MREKMPLNVTVDKYINFLQTLYIQQSYNNQSLKEIVQMFKINKTVLKALVTLKLLEIKSDSEWICKYQEIDKKLALEVLNFLLELNKKQIVTPITGLDDETKQYIREIRDHLISNSQNKLCGLDGLKTPMLSKALNQMEPSQSNHLFTQVESNEAKRFELLKAVASGWYADPSIMDFRHTNSRIIEATEDLFNKFFKK